LIGATLEGKEVQLVGTNNGDGIATEITEQIFTPSFTTKPHGSGLGLSQARKIMNLHRGTITAENGNGEKKLVVRI